MLGEGKADLLFYVLLSAEFLCAFRAILEIVREYLLFLNKPPEILNQNKPPFVLINQLKQPIQLNPGYKMLRIFQIFQNPIQQFLLCQKSIEIKVKTSKSVVRSELIRVHPFVEFVKDFELEVEVLLYQDCWFFELVILDDYHEVVLLD